MTTKTIVISIALLAAAGTPVVLMGQGAATQFAIAQPKAPAVTQTPAIATRARIKGLPAGSSPIVILQPSVIAPNPVFAPGLLFPQNQMFVSNPVFAPTQAVIPNQFVLPLPSFPGFQTPAQVNSPTQLLVPGQTVIPPTTAQPAQGAVQAHFGLPSAAQTASKVVAPGSSRAEVVRQLGQPSVTVFTNTGETLYFDGGRTVTLQNGQVTGSR